jgi:hypothetical protein
VRRQAAFLEQRTVADRAPAVPGVLEIVGLRGERLPAWALPELLNAGLPPDAVPQGLPGGQALES